MQDLHLQPMTFSQARHPTKTREINGTETPHTEKQLKDLQEAYGEAMLELRARKKLAALMERDGVRGERATGSSAAPNK